MKTRTRNQLYAPVFQGLIDPKHIKNFGPNPVFMYLHLLIRESRHHGRIQNGVPITDSELARTFGQSTRTIQRWRTILVTCGYIEAKKTYHGYIYEIRKSKKFGLKTVTSNRTQLSSYPDEQPDSSDQKNPSNRTVGVSVSLQTIDEKPTCEIELKNQRRKVNANTKRGIEPGSIADLAGGIEQCWREGSEVQIAPYSAPPIVQCRKTRTVEG